MTSRGPLTGLLLLLGLAAPAAAQHISGLALGPDGGPLPNVPVALHRVGGSANASVATRTTDARGRFTFEIEVADSAVYFAAIRHEGRLYIGPPVRGGSGRVSEYEIRAEPSYEAGAVASALSRSVPGVGGMQRLPRGGSGTGSAAVAGVLGLLALAMVVTFLAVAPGYRRKRRRELVLELASIENRLADADRTPEAGLEQRRQQLRERLEPRT